MMNHDEALELLPDLLQDRLDEPSRARLRKHLEDCRECSEAKTTLELLATAAPGDDDAHAHHPTSEEIVAFALDEPWLSADQKKSISRHVQSCLYCRTEIEATQQADRMVEPVLAHDEPSPPAQKGADRWPWAALAAAAVLVAALAYPAVLGLFQLPAARSQIASLRESAGLLQAQVGTLEDRLEGMRSELEKRRGLAGFLPFHVLQSPARGTRSATEITLESGEPHVLLLVELAGREVQTAPGESVVQLTIEPLGWTEEIPVTMARDYRTQFGGLPLVLPAARLSDEPQLLEVFLVENSHAPKKMASVTFTVIQQR
jgi:hypothetical protein